MGKFFNLFKKAYNKKIDASGLAIFRVLYGVVLLCDIVQLYYYRHLIFDKIPYLEPAEISYGIPLILWMLSVVFLVFGLFTKQSAIINYIFSLVFIATIDTYEYHMYYIYMAINFLLIFLNTHKVFSLDNLIKKLKYSNTRFDYTPSRKTSVLNYYIFILLGIGFTYFDSVFYKFSSPLWLQGLGVWLPSSVPQITHVNLTWILNQKWLMLFLGYVTLIFETIFILTFYRKYWRIPLLIIGIGLHLGIVLFFPIPRFGLGMIALYLLMVPVSFWVWCRSKITFKSPKLVFYYDEECPLCNRTKIVLGHFDYLKAIEFKGVQTYGFEDERLKDRSKEDLLNNIYSITRSHKILYGIDTYRASFKYIVFLFPLYIILRIPGIYHLGKWVYRKVAENRYVERCTEENCGFTPPAFPASNDEMKLTKGLKLIDLKVSMIFIGCVFLALLQINVTLHSDTMVRLYSSINSNVGQTEKLLNHSSILIRSFSKRLFGITTHAVFVNDHFDGYNHTLAIVYKSRNDIWLPITNPDGTLGPWQVGPIWAKWGFRINSANINEEDLAEGIRDITAFWAFKNEIDLESARFEIKVKKNSTPTGWEKDFLQNQLDNPWLSGGYVTWKDKEFYENIKYIESL
ncbi:DCC1-like thiol-disulfide oxidoreductase family protein [Salinimicrobium sp. WS361]|uniref:DCC1-like thiol-disulfide oxidoreductase family protein n=1 Tax=Salinimicrobium sp. WS361 TaxID=3425123 RepID=UPI003D6DE57B